MTTGSKRTASQALSPGARAAPKRFRLKAAEYESFIGSAYLDPIFRLIDGLEELPNPSKVNQVQSSPRVYGQSCSIIALSVLMLESAINISKHVTSSTQKSSRAYFTQTFGQSSFKDEVCELFALRDVIAHNHVWRGKYHPIGMKWTRNSPRLLPGYGDANFRAVTDMSTKTTKRLGLNVIPTKLSLVDVRTVLKTVGAILNEMRDWHIANYKVMLSVATNRHVTFRGHLVSFKSAIAAL